MRVKPIDRMVAGLALSALASPAFASSASAGMPWESPLNAILQSLQGPTAKVLILIAIVVTGLMAAFGEAGTTMRKVLAIAFGASIALGAASFLAGLGLSAAVV